MAQLQVTLKIHWNMDDFICCCFIIVIQHWQALHNCISSQLDDQIILICFFNCSIILFIALHAWVTMSQNPNFSVVEAKHVEVQSGTQTKISCIIKGITGDVTVTWQLAETNPYPDGSGTGSQDKIEIGNNSQTRSLMVQDTQVTPDEATNKMLDYQALEGSFTGPLSDGTQISTWSISNPQEDQDYICVVTFGQFPALSSLRTTVSLLVYCEFCSNS